MFIDVSSDYAHMMFKLTLCANPSKRPNIAQEKRNEKNNRYPDMSNEERYLGAEPSPLMQKIAKMRRKQNRSQMKRKRISGQ